MACARFWAKRFPKGRVIFEEGDPGDYLYVITSGQVRVYLLNADGREVTLRAYGPSEVFGELAVLDGQPRSAGASALDDVRAFALHRDDFRAMLRDNFALVEHVIGLLVERLRYTTIYAERLAFLDARGRLAAALLQLSSTDLNTDRPARLTLTQQELAGFAGATREWVNHALREFADAGLVQIERGAVIVLDRTGLRQKMSMN
jgi:CRP-like cAMP-binding protein